MFRREVEHELVGETVCFRGFKHFIKRGLGVGVEVIQHLLQSADKGGIVLWWNAPLPFQVRLERGSLRN